MIVPMNQSQRRDGEVQRLSETECSLTSSLRDSQYMGTQTYRGLAFTVTSGRDLQLLTLELNSNNKVIESVDVQVYFREGSWTNVLNDPSKWTKLADTKPKIAPDSKGAIIPAQEFKPALMKQNIQYSLYLFISNHEAVKVREASMIGTPSNSDDYFMAFTGVGLTKGLFGTNNIGNPGLVHIEGAFHYKLTHSCDKISMTTVVELEWAINDNPLEERIKALGDVVETLMTDLVEINSKFINWKYTYFLEMTDIETKFAGRSEKCPVVFDMCSLVKTFVTFKHLHELESGVLRKDVIGMEDEIGAPVEAKSDVEVKYVGGPIILRDFVFTLYGVEKILDFRQKRYFERVTTAFLDEFTSIPIYVTRIKEINLVEQEEEDSGERKLSNSLRGTNNKTRQLQDGAIEVLATLYSDGDLEGLGSEVMTQVIDAISENLERYIAELTLQHLRPGDIGRFGSIFDTINHVRAVYIVPRSELPPTEAPTTSSPTISPTEPLEDDIVGDISDAVGDIREIGILNLSLYVAGGFFALFLLYLGYKRCKKSSQKKRRDSSRKNLESLQRAYDKRESLKRGQQTNTPPRPNWGRSRSTGDLFVPTRGGSRPSSPGRPLFPNRRNSRSPSTSRRSLSNERGKRAGLARANSLPRFQARSMSKERSFRLSEHGPPRMRKEESFRSTRSRSNVNERVKEGSNRSFRSNTSSSPSRRIFKRQSSERISRQNPEEGFEVVFDQKNRPKPIRSSSLRIDMAGALNRQDNKRVSRSLSGERKMRKRIAQEFDLDASSDDSSVDSSDIKITKNQASLVSGTAKKKENDEIKSRPKRHLDRSRSLPDHALKERLQDIVAATESSDSANDIRPEKIPNSREIKSPSAFTKKTKSAPTRSKSLPGQNLRKQLQAIKDVDDSDSSSMASDIESNMDEIYKSSQSKQSKKQVKMKKKDAASGPKKDDVARENSGRSSANERQRRSLSGEKSSRHASLRDLNSKQNSFRESNRRQSSFRKQNSFRDSNQSPSDGKQRKSLSSERENSSSSRSQRGGLSSENHIKQASLRDLTQRQSSFRESKQSSSNDSKRKNLRELNHRQGSFRSPSNERQRRSLSGEKPVRHTSLRDLNSKQNSFRESNRRQSSFRKHNSFRDSNQSPSNGKQRKSLSTERGKESRSKSQEKSLSKETAQSKFTKSQFVYYKNKGEKEVAKVVEVHLDDDLVPFYTILLRDSRKEKQTDEAHLSPVSRPTSANVEKKVHSEPKRGRSREKRTSKSKTIKRDSSSSSEEDEFDFNASKTLLID